MFLPLMSAPCLSFRSDSDVALYVDANTHIQILDNMSCLPHADKEQCAAFIVSGALPSPQPATDHPLLHTHSVMIASS